MLDSLSLNPFKFSDAGKKKGSPFGFHMLSKGNNLFDGVTGTPAVCSISGARWGIVNGVVAQFAANQPRIEDKGFGACPAFTQYVSETENYNSSSWYNVSGGTLSTPGGNRLVYGGGAINDYLIEAYLYIPEGTASKIMMLVADVSASNYPQTFRLKNTHGGVKDNFSEDIILTKPEKIYFRVVNDSSIGTGIQNVGVLKSSNDSPFDINISLNLAEANFIYPYSPNNTGSSVSVVSEAATSTTGTSFDLDASTLSRLKSGLRGPKAQGHIELEVESNVDSGWLANNTFLNILSINNNNINGIVYKKDGSGTSTFKGIDSVIGDCSVTISGLTVGQTFRIFIDYGTYTDGTQKMRLTVNGVKSSVVAFSGSFGTQDLKFFYGALLHAFFIKLGSFKFIPKPIW